MTTVFYNETFGDKVMTLTTDGRYALQTSRDGKIRKLIEGSVFVGMELHRLVVALKDNRVIKELLKLKRRDTHTKYQHSRELRETCQVDIHLDDLQRSLQVLNVVTCKM